MKTVLTLATIGVLLADCSQTPTQPTSTPGVTQAPVASPPPAWTTSIWTTTSTVLAVTGRNSCATDATVGVTTSGIGWTFRQAADSIELIEAVGAFDLRTPYYTGSRTGSQFTTTTWQDGGFDCFVYSGSFSGSFSDDGSTFDAVEIVDYVHFGEESMEVRRQWTGRRR